MIIVFSVRFCALIMWFVFRYKSERAEWREPGEREKDLRAAQVHELSAGGRSAATGCPEPKVIRGQRLGGDGHGQQHVLRVRGEQPGGVRSAGGRCWPTDRSLQPGAGRKSGHGSTPPLPRHTRDAWQLFTIVWFYLKKIQVYKITLPKFNEVTLPRLSSLNRTPPPQVYRPIALGRGGGGGYGKEENVKKIKYKSCAISTRCLIMGVLWEGENTILNGGGGILFGPEWRPRP